MSANKPAVVLAILFSLSHVAMASDYEGAELRKGSSRGDACEKAKKSAAIHAQAAGSKNNTIKTGPCECEKVSKSENFGWECTVSWEANAKSNK